MRRLSHSGPINPTVQALLERGTRRLARARLHFGHGTERARDDAAALLWHAMRLAQPAPPAVYRRGVSPRAQRMFEALLQRRIPGGMPAVSLTQRCWFAGLPMYVDRRVLIPRSPIAELIERRFGPWIERARVRRILDLGTGSGCIAIGCARTRRTVGSFRRTRRRQLRYYRQQSAVRGAAPTRGPAGGVRA